MMLPNYKVNWKYKLTILIIDLIGMILFSYKKLKKIPKIPKKILVIRLDHLGDTIMTSSFCRNTKRNFQNSELTVLCRSIAKPIAEMIPYIDNIEILDAPWFDRDGKGSLSHLIRYTLKNCKKYDLAFELHSDPRNIILASFLARYSVGFGIRGFGFLLNKTIRYEKGIKHIVERYHDLLLGLNLNVDDKHLELSLDRKSLNKTKSILGKYIKNKNRLLLINLGVGAEERDWGTDNFRELIRLLIEKTNYNIILVDKHTSRANAILKEINSKTIINLCAKFNLKELVYLTSLVDIIVGMESMNMHIAAAFNKKVIDVHSSVTYAEEWGPYSKNSKVMQSLPVGHYYSSKKAKGMIQSIKPEEVFKEIIKT